MILESYLRNGISVLSLEGDVSAADAQTIRNELRTLLGNGRRRFVVHLARVSQMSLFTLGAFVERKKEAQLVEAQLKLAGVNDRLAETFRTFGVEKVLEVYPTEEAAIESFADCCEA